MLDYREFPFTVRIEDKDPNFHLVPRAAVDVGPTPANVVIEAVVGDPTEAPVWLNQFQSVVSRIMTPEEAEKRANQMDLPTPLVMWIVKEFVSAAESPEADGSHYGPYAGENGRIGWGMSHESFYEELAEQMGVTDETWDLHVNDENSLLNRVWNAFFEE